MNEAYLRESEELLREMATDQQKGLNEERVRQRQEQYGPNSLQETKRQPLILRFCCSSKMSWS